MNLKWILILGCLAAGCSTIKPYEKEYLLSPHMEDKSLRSLDSSFCPSVFANLEHLSGAGMGGSTTSCPTCGG